MEVSHLILFTPRRNDLQEKKNQLQCNNHVDPKKIAFSLIKLIGISIRGSNSVFQNDNLEMSLGGEWHTSEFQSSIQIDKIIYDARRQSKYSIFCNGNR